MGEQSINKGSSVAMFLIPRRQWWAFDQPEWDAGAQQANRFPGCSSNLYLWERPQLARFEMLFFSFFGLKPPCMCWCAPGKNIKIFISWSEHTPLENHGFCWFVDVLCMFTMGIFLLACPRRGTRQEGLNEIEREKTRMAEIYYFHSFSGFQQLWPFTFYQLWVLVTPFVTCIIPLKQPVVTNKWP